MTSPLRAARTRAGLSMEALGRALGVSGQTVKHYETGRCDFSRLSGTFRGIWANALGLTLRQLETALEAAPETVAAAPPERPAVSPGRFPRDPAWIFSTFTRCPFCAAPAPRHRPSCVGRPLEVA